jgi:hypothetical protein
MNFLKNALIFIKQYGMSILIRTALLSLIIIHLHYRATTGNKVNQLVNLYGKINYDINKLPNGLVIYKSEKALLDDATGILYYEIGIWDYSSDFVHYVRVPHYAHNRFIVGMNVRVTEPQKNSDKKRNNNSSPIIQV